MSNIHKFLYIVIKNACCLTLFSAYMIILQASSSGSNFYEQLQRSDVSEHLIGYQIPVLKMFKRQIKNFVGDQTATITLVYRSTIPVHVRWFYLVTDINVQYSEVPNMMTVEGDSTYKVSSLRSGQMKATTLQLLKTKDALPTEFETIISSQDGVMQYQIRTLVKEPTDYFLEEIDSPEWLVVPQPRLYFHKNNALKVICKIFVPNEKVSDHNEMRMSHTILLPSDRTTSYYDSFQLEYRTVIDIHKNSRRDNAEENGPTIMQGIREVLPRGHTIYEVRLTTINATKSFEGLYTCALESKHDKTYITSHITNPGSRVPYPQRPVVDVMPCQTKRPDSNKVIIFERGKPNCLRCKGIGYPYPRVELLDNYYKVVLPKKDFISIDTYTNVVDARVVETLYSFQNITPEIAGRYMCKAVNDHGSDTYHFNIQINYSGPL